MRPRDRAPGWEVGEGGQSRVRRLTAHLRLSSGSSAAPVPLWPFLGVTLGVERIVCQARSSGRRASGPRDCSGGQGGCGEGQHGWPGRVRSERGGLARQGGQFVSPLL